MKTAGPLAVVVAAVLSSVFAAGAEKPSAPALEQAVAAMPVGQATVKVGSTDIRFDHVFEWVPYSFADLKGLAAMLRTGKDPAPVAAATNYSFFRHRTYPLTGWSGVGEGRPDLRLTVASDEKQVTRGRVDIRAGAASCRAEVSGQCLGRGWLTGQCADGRPVAIVLNAWTTGTAFQFSDANRPVIAPHRPDWDRTQAYCAARTRGREAPFCGPEALLKLKSGYAGRQEDEPLSGTWILTASGGLLAEVPWADSLEVLVFDRVPPVGPARKVPARSLSFSGGVEAGRFLGAKTTEEKIEFDGVVLWLDKGGTRRRLVPDQLIVTGIWAGVLAPAL